MTWYPSQSHRKARTLTRTTRIPSKVHQKTGSTRVWLYVAVMDDEGCTVTLPNNSCPPYAAAFGDCGAYSYANVLGSHLNSDIFISSVERRAFIYCTIMSESGDYTSLSSSSPIQRLRLTHFPVRSPPLQ